MLMKLAIFGGLGYAGYRYFQKMQGEQQTPQTPQVALAGGPLSSAATIQSNPDIPPATVPVTGEPAPT